MTSAEMSGMIFEQFRHMFPSMALAVTHYGTWGHDSIRIETTANVSLIFEYVSKDNWALLTTQNEAVRLERASKTNRG